METPIPISVRSSSGISVASGPPSYGNVEFNGVQSKSCRNMVFSPEGRYLAFADGVQLYIVQTDNWKEVAVIAATRSYYLSFSPKDTYLTSWETFTVSNSCPEGSPNLRIYKSENGDLVKTFIHKKQANWEPQWSSDEEIVARLINTDVVFYENANFEKILYRINCYKCSSFSLSPSMGTYYVLCHNPGGSGQPSVGRLFKYPNFEGHQSLANKSFFQADKVEFYWNSKATHALLLTSTEVDKTGGSYYGKHSLHFVSTAGETYMVNLGKEGPIYDVSWSPKNQEFCVIYGFMPARSTIFNLKCEPAYELGTGPRNSIYYNPQGNILLLGGFGNLRGQVEIWDIQSRKLIGKCEAPDSTLLQWSPDGIHFLTATTAPRLRIGNGYKIWHFSGSLLFEKPWDKEELYDVQWQNYPKNTFKEPVITSQKVEGIISSQPQASQQVYRPPSARNRTIAFNLHDDEVQAHRPGGESAPSKAALKLRKKREARKARKVEEGEEPPSPTKETNKTTAGSLQVTLTGDPEKDKKIKSLKKKLDAIAKLKEQQIQGKSLEINQLSKIKAENELLQELKQLQL